MAKKPQRNRKVRKAAKKSQPKAGKNEALLAKLKRYVRAHAEGYLADPNITSMGIGYKQIAGQKTPELAVQFSVDAKVRPEDVSSVSTKAIPPTLNVEGTTVPTDVIQRKYTPSYKTIAAQATDPRKVRADVIIPGISIGSVATNAGTLGAFARDRQTQQIVILSNWHVLHGPTGHVGDDVVQPGRYDDNSIDGNVVGKLLRSHLGPAGDCAIASLSGRNFSNDIYELGVSFGRIGEPQLDDHVVKSGRTTAVTRGIVTRIEVNTKMNYGEGVEATVGGFEIGPDPNHLAPSNEISRGGDSGSAWMAVDASGKVTDIMLGLHFAGDDDEGGPSEFALACYANSIVKKLEIDPIGVTTSEAVAEGADEFRQGFDKNFLSFFVDVPKFRPNRQNDLAKLDSDTEVRYCHFSVWLSKKRRYPTCVAWNVDGSKFKRLKRVSFRTDRRGNLEDYQLTNDIYSQNVLDKGHIARRADLCWGPMDEARQGNYDSFYYTNIAPQHQAFNQSDDTSSDPEGGVWGRLENTVFDSEAPHDLKVSLMGGPVFSTKDRKFEQNNEECILPREYWKVVAYVDDTDSKEKVFGFLLTQASLIEGLTVPEGLDFDAWLWARISLKDLQEKTGVIFPKEMKDREQGFVKPQALGVVMSVKPMFSQEDYFKG